MVDFDSYQELRNRKRYKTNSDYKMNEKASTDYNGAGNSWVNMEEEVPEISILSQEAVNEQIKGFVAPSYVS